MSSDVYKKGKQVLGEIMQNQSCSFLANILILKITTNFSEERHEVHTF